MEKQNYQSRVQDALEERQKRRAWNISMKTAAFGIILNQGLMDLRYLENIDRINASRTQIPEYRENNLVQRRAALEQNKDCSEQVSLELKKLGYFTAASGLLALTLVSPIISHKRKDII